MILLKKIYDTYKYKKIKFIGIKFMEEKNAKNILELFKGQSIFILNSDRTKYEEITCNNYLFKAIIGMLIFIINSRI